MYGKQNFDVYANTFQVINTLQVSLVHSTMNLLGIKSMACIGFFGYFPHPSVVEVKIYGKKLDSTSVSVISSFNKCLGGEKHLSLNGGQIIIRRHENEKQENISAFYLNVFGLRSDLHLNSCEFLSHRSFVPQIRASSCKK